ncbi:hypothetical protein [Chryseobacterium sp. c4a]|uniref:hypothetical protein n=1 Tax=Chryseobacterium sp. c4a TaxID=1573582 RepID=UPI0013569143|nr:hypothetical protein [Chryseobacterium sp. c4a]
MSDFIFIDNPFKDLDFKRLKAGLKPDRSFEDSIGLVNPYDGLLEVLKSENLIEEFWQKFNNSLPLKKEGFDLQEKYKAFDVKINAENRSVSYSLKIGYEVVRYTKHFLYFLNKFLGGNFRDVETDFLLFLSLQDQKEANFIVNQLVADLCEVLGKLNNQTVKVQTDKVVLNLVNLYVENDLKRISNTYFDVITPVNQKRVKKIFPNLVDLLEYKQKFLSFKIHSKQQRPTKVIESLFKSLKGNGLINSSTQLHSFREVFEGKQNSAKVDWVENKATLFYFITQLVENEIIERDYNIWKKVSYCITLNTREIDSLKNSRATESQDKREKVDRVISRVLQMR